MRDVPATTRVTPFLVAGGEMAARVREKDWSKTPLGPIESWSPALRTTTSLLLANRFPMLLWWGPDSVSIYNDAYIPVLGVKHPDALGLPVSECWAEIYDVLRPLILTPLNGGPATWSEDLLLEIRRHGFLEETHWTIAYSPVPDETAPNGIGGVLATVHEITAQIVGQRRTGLLRDLGARAGEAKSAEEACVTAAAAFGRHPLDVPFALVYLRDDNTGTTRLVATTGDQRDALTTDWPIAEALRTGKAQMVEGLARALVLPLDGGPSQEAAGALVVGLSPRLAFDDAYRDFLALAAAQLASAIINARAYDLERRRAESLAALDRSKTAFFSNVSHELRTPLTLMLGHVADGLDDTHDPLSSGQRHRQKVVQRNAQRLLKLVNSLLDFSRIEAARTRAAYEPTDIAELTMETASTFRSLVEGAGLELVLDCEPLAAPVFVDRGMWETIVLNLLSNAFKFTLEGVISVTLTGDEDCARLVIRDTGTGIDAAHLPHVFERFYRVDGAEGRTYEGTGIGLALVRELTKLHGGSTLVESVKGVGTAFTVTVPMGTAHLPEDRVVATATPESKDGRAWRFLQEAQGWVASEDPPRAAAASPALSDVPSDPNAATTRLLVADDNADMRAYLARLLRPLGTVELVKNGREALDAIKRQLPDLVLSDVMMPDLDGVGLVRALRDDPRTRTLPIVLLSARAGEDARVDGAGIGADDYIVKPFAARELLARVKAQLALSRLRREHAEALLEIEGKFRALVTASSDVVYRMSPDWSEMRHLVGHDFIADTDGPSGSWLQRYIHPDDQARVLSAIREAIEAKSLFELEHRVLRVDGTLGWTHSRALPLKGANGEIIEWLGTANDVTARHRAQERVRADLDAMTRLQKLGAVYLREGELAPVLAEIVDAAIAISGGVAGDIQVTDPHTGALQTLAQKGGEGGEGEHAAIEETPLVSRSGTLLGFMTVRYPNPGHLEDRAVRLLDLLARQAADIIERSEIESSLRHVNELLAEADRRKNEFLAMLSHELRNPLTPIVTGLALLKAVPPGDPRAERAMTIIERQVGQLSNLVNDLLDVTRITRNKVQLHTERLELNEIVRRAVEDNRTFFDRAGVRLELVLADQPIAVVADRTRLGQVVGNLLHNAAKFTTSGGLTRVTVGRAGRAAIVRVSDDGVGMTRESLEHLFQPFVQVEQTLDRSKGGLGLGLALVKRLVELHGGSVSATSEGIGRGTSIEVCLPLDQVNPTVQPPSSAGERRARRRVLIIEDNIESAEVLGEALGVSGHEVVVAHNGAEGLVEARKFHPDVVLCDIGLPGMDGYEVARAFRADSNLKSTYLVALSGYALPEDLRRAADAGFDKHLAKPPVLSKLEQVLAAAAPGA